MEVLNGYDRQALYEMKAWQREMQRRPSILGGLTRNLQKRVNRVIPDKVHSVITAAFKHMVNGVLKGAEFISGKPYRDAGQLRETRVQDRITIYKNTSAAEGAITGAGGILLGLADFPMWLTLKMKMLSDICGLYGHDVSDYKERLYMLYVFQLAFSGREHRRKIFAIVHDWEQYSKTLPAFKEEDWLAFQQEYRDYIDLAKLLQLIPGVGAVVGAYVNHRYTDKLGKTAMNAYRMRWFGNTV